MHVPTLNFKDTSLYSFSGLGDGTSPLLTRLTSATVSNMAILPMQAIAPNTTYHHEFLGPSLRCDTTTGSRLAKMDAIWNLTEKSIEVPIASAGSKLMYLAYTLDEARYGRSSPFNASDFVTGCVIGGMCFPDPIFARVGNESVTCVVQDTHFDLDFRSVDTTQSIVRLSWKWLSESDVSSEPVYQTIPQVLATILNGAIGAWAAGPATQQYDDGGSGLVTYRTRVMSTALIGLVSTAFSGPAWPALQDLPRADHDLAANRTLAQMIEELSRNQTLSLFSSDRLW
jgi:hypothetical protein